MASSTTETVQHLNTTHKMLQGAVDHFAKHRFNLTDDHVNELRGVQKHLRDYQTHYEVAHSTQPKEEGADHPAMRLGGGALGKFNETPAASEHLAEMHTSLMKAHRLLTNSDVYNTHKDKLTGPKSLPDAQHLEKQEKLVAGLSYLGAGGKRKASKGYDTFRVGESKFRRHPEGHFVDEGGAKVTPEKIDEMAKKFGESHPGVQKFRQAEKGTRRTRQYDLKKPGSPKVGKGMGSAPQEVSDDPNIRKAQNTSGVVKDTVDPKKKASKGYRQANYAGVSSEMGKKNPADVIENIKSPTQADRNRAAANEVTRNDPFMRNPGTRQAVKRGIRNSRVKNMMLGQNQQLESIRSNKILDQQTTRNAVNKRRGQS